MIVQGTDFKFSQDSFLFLKESERWRSTLLDGFENKNGDKMYTPIESKSDEVRIFDGHILAKKNKALILQLILTCGVITATGYLTISEGGKIMSYIPLFIALTPLVYWSSKIASAFLLGHLYSPKTISYISKSSSGDLVKKVEIPKDGASILDATLELLKKERRKNGQ